MADTNLVYPITIQPKDLREWLGLITSVIRDLKSSGVPWESPPELPMYDLMNAVGYDPDFANNITSLILQKATEQKNYTDSVAQGISKKAEVRAGTTQNITLNSTTTTIDGVVLANGNKVLVKNQTTKSQNGVYVVNTSGAWVRDTEFDESAELISAFIFIKEGSTLANTGWVVASSNKTINVGTDDIVWAQFSAVGSILGDNVTIVKNGDTFSLKSGVVTPGTYNKVTVDQYGRVIPTSKLATYLGDLGITVAEVAATDWNNYGSAGFFFGSSAVANAPTSGESYYVLVLNTGATANCAQIAINQATDAIYMRQRYNAAWRAWNRIDPDPSLVVRTDKPSTMAKSATLSKVANVDSTTYTLIDQDAKIYRAVYNDLAELFEHEEPSEPGDILVSNNGKVVKSSKSLDRRVVGVHSDTWGMILGGENKEDPKENFGKFTPVGISGRVLVKISGNVDEGDYIVSSGIAGVGKAVKEYTPGTIVGKALESREGEEGVYRVWMLIMNC